MGFNTPSPLNIKITPLVGKNFQHKSSNDILNFCTDWLVSSFYLVLEANILIGAFYCMDNINKGKFFKLESDKYTIWLFRQISMDYSRTLFILYGKPKKFILKIIISRILQKKTLCIVKFLNTLCFTKFNFS